MPAQPHRDLGGRRRRVGRLPPGARHPYPAGLHDCYAALSYLHAEADAPVSTRRGGRGPRERRRGTRRRRRAARTVVAPICFHLLAIPELDDRLQTPST